MNHLHNSVHGNGGILNPQRIDTITKTLCVDTIFRKNYSTTLSTDCLFHLPEPMNNVVSIKLSALEMPNMWYRFSSADKSNQFIIHCYNVPFADPISGDYSPYDESYLVTIPDGNYLAGEFEEIMNNILSNTSGGLAYVRYQINAYDTRSFFRASNTDDVDGLDPYVFNNVVYNAFYFTLQFDVDSLPLSKCAGWMMGFRNPIYVANRDSQFVDIIADDFNTLYNYIKSESSYGSSSLQYFFLELDDFQRNCVPDKVISSTGNDYLGNNILARITATSSHNTIVMDTGMDRIFKKRVYFGPIRLDKFHIRVFDRHGHILNINGNDFSFVLEVEQSWGNPQVPP